MGWFQVLPVGQKASTPLQFNVMHILPSSKIPFPKVPLDVMISNKLTFLKKNEKRLKDQSRLGQHDHVPVHLNELDAAEEGLILIDEFEFPHAIYQVGPTEMNAEGLVYGYKKLFNFLKLKEKQHLGITLIVSPQWMFLGQIQQPYHREPQPDVDVEGKTQEGGIPVYHDGYAYSGIFNL